MGEEGGNECQGEDCNNECAHVVLLLMSLFRLCVCVYVWVSLESAPKYVREIAANSRCKVCRQTVTQPWSVYIMWCALFIDFDRN